LDAVSRLESVERKFQGHPRPPSSGYPRTMRNATRVRNWNEKGFNARTTTARAGRWTNCESRSQKKACDFRSKLGRPTHRSVFKNASRMLWTEEFTSLAISRDSSFALTNSFDANSFRRLVS
jgi:hypothetical protein